MDNDYNYNKVKWSKAIGYGVLLWIVMFILGSVFVALNIGLNTWSVLVLAVLAGLFSYSLAMNAHPINSKQALAYGATFAVVGLLLDMLITQQMKPEVFNNWTYWLGYFLVLVAPFGAVGKYRPTTQFHG